MATRTWTASHPGSTARPAAASGGLIHSRSPFLDMDTKRFLRSPRETMDGWVHLPRYIDKIRLHLAGRDDVQTRADLIDADEGRIP